MVDFKAFDGNRPRAFSQQTGAMKANKIICINGRGSHSGSVGASPRSATKQGKSSFFYGNPHTQEQLPGAILTSKNWGQAARKIGDYRLAFEVLQRHFETLPPVIDRRAA